jgi:transcription initiation factor TFIID TATA-box-binding protein
MVCTVAKSSRQARKAIRKVVRELKDNGIIIMRRPKITIQNIVASADLGGRVDLEKTLYSLDRTLYEPEQFPGLIYRMRDPKAVLLLFASGKLVCTGAKKEQDVYASIIKVSDQLEQDNLIFYSTEPHGWSV